MPDHPPDDGQNRLLDERSSAERSVDHLDADVLSAARRALQGLVERAGGAQSQHPIPVDHVDVVANLFEAWARHHGELDATGGTRFGPQPGLWHALQGAHPIARTARWAPLRMAVLEHLERHRGWERESPPRGSKFFIP